MKVVFVDPSHYLHNYGMRILAAQVQRFGHDVEMVFALGAFSAEPKRTDRIYADLLEHVRTADLVGLSIYTNYYLEAVGVTKLIKEAYDVRICAPFFEPVDGLISAKDSGGIIGFGMNLE